MSSAPRAPSASAAGSTLPMSARIPHFLPSAPPAPGPSKRFCMRDLGARALVYGLAGAVFAVDRFTKWIIESRFGPYDNVVVIPGFFEIVHSENQGAAFGLFAESTSAWRTVLLIGFSVVALIA